LRAIVGAVPAVSGRGSVEPERKLRKRADAVVRAKSVVQTISYVR
jgi:hypothetical protein